jgi:hypothetical protein
MANLIELDLGDGRTVLVESDEDISVPRSVRGAVGYQKVAPDTTRRTEFSSVQDSLRCFVDGAVSALRGVDADIERVQFQFSLSLGGDAGVPFITKGRDQGTLNVTVQCNLSKRSQRLSLDPDE